MRLKILLKSSRRISLPYSYQYWLHSAIYDLIRKSSPDYSQFLHDTGFIDENKHLKLFVFSRLFFAKAVFAAQSIKEVEQAELYFSTPIPKSFEHLVLGIFSDQKLLLKTNMELAEFDISLVETLPEPIWTDEMKFICLSPIAVAGKSEEHSGKHFFDYMKPEEKERFIGGIRDNLLRKYRLIRQTEFGGKADIDFNFDPLYIVKKQGRIRKRIHFKGTEIIGMEAPFTISADPQLIQTGYECGFGENNSAGFGMVEMVKEK